jgi:hypothetical protein
LTATPRLKSTEKEPLGASHHPNNGLSTIPENGSVVGAWLGAGIVATRSRRKIQIGMGAALLAAAVFFMMANLGLFPAGGNVSSLSGPCPGQSWPTIELLGGFPLTAGAFFYRHASGNGKRRIERWRHL